MQASQPTQFLLAQGLEGGDVLQPGGVQRAHGVQPKQVEADPAEMHAVDRPVLQPPCAQGAAVTHALVEDAPGPGQAVAILPESTEDFLVRANAAAQSVEHGRVPCCVWESEKPPCHAGGLVSQCE